MNMPPYHFEFRGTRAAPKCLLCGVGAIDDALHAIYHSRRQDMPSPHVHPDIASYTIHVIDGVAHRSPLPTLRITTKATKPKKKTQRRR